MLQPDTALPDSATHVLYLPTVKQRLSQDLLITTATQPVRVQLTEGINVGSHPCWRVDDARGEA